MVARTVSANPSRAKNSRRSTAPELSVSKTVHTALKLSRSCEIPSTSIWKVLAKALTTSSNSSSPLSSSSQYLYQPSRSLRKSGIGASEATLAKESRTNLRIPLSSSMISIYSMKPLWSASHKRQAASSVRNLSIARLSKGSCAFSAETTSSRLSLRSPSASHRRNQAFGSFVMLGTSCAVATGKFVTGHLAPVLWRFRKAFAASKL
mmetsp:Transcript_55547/g.130403  ORF Transcript_55547/g.130403 Transcript_55547/m.130403 type:complete len:207 (-) Transcript_55547:185-805(-)